MRIFCSICKDIFIPYSEVHVTKCGHLYHESCISTWIKQHKTCPQCRSKTSDTFRVFFDVDKDNETDPSTLEHEMEILSDKLREAERQKKSLEENYVNLGEIVDNMKECAVSLTKKNDLLKTSVKALKGQVAKLTQKKELIETLESEVEMWKNKVQTFERVQTILKGSTEETNKLIAATPVTELAVKQLCVYVGVLKTQLMKLEEKYNRLNKENNKTLREIALKVGEDLTVSEEIKKLRLNNTRLEAELNKLNKLYEELKKEQNKKEENYPSDNYNYGEKCRKSLFQMVIDEVNNDTFHCSPIKEDKKINNWEKLVSAGPSRNVGLKFHKSKLIKRDTSNDSTEQTASSSIYAFDGLGGRKKLRLGGPTPAEEFDKIKKKKIKKPNIQQNKIIDFCILE